jgi:predicted RNA-binding Zn-ribbon protein involved in translation (DUF1610 family)
VAKTGPCTTSGMRIRTKLKRLKNPDPKFVSLVARGANQIPFRIMKSNEGNTMIDLSKPQRIFKSMFTNNNVAEVETPVVAAAPVVTEIPVGDEPTMGAIVVMKGDEFEASKERVSKAGFKVDAPVEQADGTVVFSQGGDAPEAGTVMKMDEGLLLVVKGFDPEQQEKMAAFNERVGAEGYNLGLGEACNNLSAVFSSVVKKSATPEEAIAGINEAMEDFHDYVDGMLEGLPRSAFTADIILPTVVVKASCPDCGKSMVHKCDTAKKADETATAPVVEAVVQPVATTPAPEKAPVAAPPAQETVIVKSDPVVIEGMASITAALKNITETQNTLGLGLQQVMKANSDLAAEVKAVAAKTDAAEKVIKSTIVAPATPGDAPAEKNGESVKKAAETGPGTLGGGFYDSAMDKTRNRR